MPGAKMITKVCDQDYVVFKGLPTFYPVLLILFGFSINVTEY